MPPSCYKSNHPFIESKKVNKMDDQVFSLDKPSGEDEIQEEIEDEIEA